MGYKAALSPRGHLTLCTPFRVLQTPVVFPGVQKIHEFCELLYSGEALLRRFLWPLFRTVALEAAMCI